METASAEATRGSAGWRKCDHRCNNQHGDNFPEHEELPLVLTCKFRFCLSLFKRVAVSPAPDAEMQIDVIVDERRDAA
jgi:hypothetical protein